MAVPFADRLGAQALAVDPGEHTNIAPSRNFVTVKPRPHMLPCTHKAMDGPAGMGDPHVRFFMRTTLRLGGSGAERL
jgi:hypothetical protein